MYREVGEPEGTTNVDLAPALFLEGQQEEALRTLEGVCGEAEAAGDLLGHLRATATRDVLLAWQDGLPAVPSDHAGVRLHQGWVRRGRARSVDS